MFDIINDLNQNNNQISLSQSQLNNLQYILKDLLQGDSKLIEREELKILDFNKIKIALNYLLNNSNLVDEKQKLELINNSWIINYRDRPPTPEEFITEKYLGPTANATWPHIKKAFIEFMDPSKPYRTLVLYPHIGWGKSYLAILINVYIGVHLSMMRAPWKFFNLNPSSIITQVFAAVSLKKSSELLYEPMLQILESSSFFERVHTKEGMIKKEQDILREGKIDKIYWTTATPTSVIQFSGGANFKLISSPNGLLGQSILVGTMTELGFFYEAGKSQNDVYKFFTKLRGRIESRFKGHYFSRFILDSSPNNLESVIDDWIVNVAPKNKSNYIISGPRWKYFPGDFPEDVFDEKGNVRPEKAFVVFKGGKGKPPKILDPQESLDKYDPLDLVFVPDTPLMRGHFEENVFEALKDIAGIPAGTADRIFYDLELLESIFSDKLRNIYTCIVADSKDPPEKLIWNQIKDIFFIKVIDRYQFWRNPNARRVWSVDQSISGDATAICVSHCERQKYYNHITNTYEYRIIYVVDMTIVIIPKKGRINLDAIKYFIEDLRNIGNLNLEYGSYDNFESESAMQYLIRQGFEVEKLSVDKTMDAYLNLINIIESKTLKAGKNIFLKNNLRSLQIVKRKNSESMKIDHLKGEVLHEGNMDWNTSRIGLNQKDVTDALAANIELLKKYNVLPIDIYDEETIEEKNREITLKKNNELLEKLGFNPYNK